MKRLTYATLLLLLSGICAGVFTCLHRREAAVKLAKNEVAAIRRAILQYYQEYGTPLDPNRDAFRVLSSGDNPRGIIFLAHMDPNHWPNDRYIDPWKRPYLYDLTDPEKPLIWSLGPDGRQSDDDIMSQ